ncbi:MAG: YicC family protein, partial [Planctomycetes bacterium]|nr:YicC family protein [Planctomycetota bacterium]
RSVNHRFLSVKVSMPELLARSEGEVEQLVREHLARGSVTVSVTMKSEADEAPALPSPARIKQVYRTLDSLRKSLGLETPVTLDSVLAIPNLIAPANHQGELARQACPVARKLALQAIEQLIEMRTCEGETVCRDILKRLDAIDRLVKRIRERAPSVLEAYQRKLDERIGVMLAAKGLEVAKQDLVKEVALYAERVDISEEIQRLSAHVESFRRITKESGPIGRKLDFLTQEMLRETNTLASKGSHCEISSCAVEIKTELEKIKEQAENVE